MMDVFWTVIYVYGGIGGVVALAFVLVGIDHIDAAAHRAYLVRPLLLPGLTLLWPIVLVRWIVLEQHKGPSR
jgi:hypothetical protein